MFRNIGEIAKLLANKQALAETIKEQVPGLLAQVMLVISAECGAQPGEATSVTMFTAETETGTTTMARVNRIDAFGVVGEELGTIDVPAALKNVPNSVITDMLPF